MDIELDAGDIARLNLQLMSLRMRKDLVTGLRKTMRFTGSEKSVDASMGWEVPWNFVGSIVEGEWKVVVGSEGTSGEVETDTKSAEAESEMVKSDSGHGGKKGEQGEEDADDGHAEKAATNSQADKASNVGIAV